MPKILVLSPWPSELKDDLTCRIVTQLNDLASIKGIIAYVTYELLQEHLKLFIALEQYPLPMILVVDDSITKQRLTTLNLPGRVIETSTPRQTVEGLLRQYQILGLAIF